MKYFVSIACHASKAGHELTMGADRRLHIEVEATSAIDAVERVQKGLNMLLNMASISDEAFRENTQSLVTITTSKPNTYSRSDAEKKWPIPSVVTPKPTRD